MKILVYTTSTNNTNTVIDSLRYLGEHEIVSFQYDEKFYKQVAQVLQSNSTPGLREAIMAHQFPPPGPEREAWLRRCSMAQEMIDAAKYLLPDLILYISAWEGDFVPTNETLKAIGEIGPLVHLCFDASDPPWWPQMAKFEFEKLFSLTVNIDGGHEWPGGSKWHHREIYIDQKPPSPLYINGLTVLTPCDPRYFEGVQVSFRDRPYAVGYAGNAGGWIRGWLMQQMQRNKGHIFAYRARDDHPQSYRMYCDFLRHCRVVISVPFSGSNAVKQVKGRVVEAGWAGACLLEWKNDATASWFTPRADYEEYRDVQDCLDMAEWLASKPERCEEIAYNLHRKVTTEHSPQKIWGAVFERLDLRKESSPQSRLKSEPVAAE